LLEQQKEINMKNNLFQNNCKLNRIRHSLTFLLVFILLFGLVACGGQNATETETVTATQESETQSIQESAEVAETEPVIVERDLGPEPLQTANQATALALRYYIFARLKTEEFTQVDFETLPEGEFQAQIDELVSIWQTADILTSEAELITDQAVLLLETASGDQTSDFDQSQTQFDTLASRDPGYPGISLASYTGQVIDRQTWAENLSKQYDALRGGQRYKQLAQQLGTDTKTAVEQMELAQKIIRNAADLEEAQAEVSEYTRSINVVEGYKTGSKVGLFVGATIATGGGTLTALAGSSMSLPVAGAVIVGGVDCIVDVGQTTSSIILGEDHKVTVDFKEAADVIQPVSMVVSLVTLDPTSAVEQIAFLGEAMMEWSNPGTVTGIAVEITKNATSRVLARMVELMGQTIPDVERTLEGLKLSLPQEEGTSLAKLILANSVGSEEAMAKMQELKAQMPQLAEADADQGQEGQEEGSLIGAPQEPTAEPNTGNSLAGTYSADAVLHYTVEDVEADSSLPVTLQLNQNGTGTANVYGFSGDAVYSGNKVSFSVGMQGITCAFEGLASRNGSSVSIDGIMQCSMMGVVAATYGWSAQN
jgi:hypothetical protein